MVAKRPVQPVKALQVETGNSKRKTSASSTGKLLIDVIEVFVNFVFRFSEILAHPCYADILCMYVCVCMITLVQ